MYIRSSSFKSIEWCHSTYSVTPESWKTSGTTLTRHSLKSRRTLSTRVTRGSSISLMRKKENSNKW